MSESVIEEFECYNCLGSGKVFRMIFFRRDCPTCAGTGTVKFDYDPTIWPDFIERTRVEIRYGINRPRIGTPA